MQIADLWAKLSIRPDKKSFSGADHLLHEMKKLALEIFAFEALKKAGEFFAEIVEGTMSSAVGFEHMAQKIGVAVEPLQQLDYAAKLSGVSTDALSIGLRKLSMSAYEASKGGKEAKDNFAALGVRATSSDGALRPVDELLGDLAEKFHEMPDGTKKTALAMRVFGRSGAEMIPLLNKGRDGIGEMREEFVKLGGQLDEETVKKFGELHENTIRLSTAWDGVKRQIATGLLPTITKLTEQFLEWWKSPANKALVKRTLEKSVHLVVEAVQRLARVFGVLLRVFGWMADHLGLLVVVLGSIAAAFVLLEAAAIGAAIASAAAWVLAALPFVLIAALIAALILIVEDLWTWFRGGESVFQKLHEWAVDMFVDAIEFWAEAFKGFFDWLVQKLDWVMDKIGAIPRAIKKAAKGISSYFTGENSDDFQDPIAEENNAVQAKRAANAALGKELARQAFAVDHQPGTGLDRFPGMDAPSYPIAPLTQAPQVNMGDVNVNVPPGTNTSEVGPVVHEALREFWDTKMRDFAPSGE